MGKNIWLAMAVLPMACLISIPGCGYQRAKLVVIKQNENTPISFLRDGQTTKSEVLSRLGELDGREFENGRILMFVLDENYRIAPSANSAQFHLTLVFDESDRRILKKHGLVRIR